MQWGTISRFSEGRTTFLRCESLEPPMSLVGQNLKLPHCDSNDWFTSISRH